MPEEAFRAGVRWTITAGLKLMSAEVNVETARCKREIGVSE